MPSARTEAGLPAVSIQGRLRVWAPAAALFLFAACATTDDPQQRVREHLLVDDVASAYEKLQLAVEANPGDADLQRRLAALRLVYHLRQGQEKVFADEDWAAVEDFERVLLADPDNVAAKQWKDKALGKLAQRAADAGDDARARGQLEQAIEHYHQAEVYVPGFAPAVRGAKLVRDVYGARRDKAQENYVKGMRAQAGGRYDQTDYFMQIAVDNDPSLSAAKERSVIARRQLAEERLKHARVAEERGWFETALREFRSVGAEFPDLVPDYEAKLASLQREVDATRKLNEATLLVQRGDFARARPMLEQAYEMSAAQRAAISSQLVALREADLDARYTAALDLEIDYRFDDALRAYKAIDASWPGQLDVRTRIQNIENSLELAREAKAKGEQAEAAGDVEAAISAYREALTYVPKFGDLAARIAKLREQSKGKTGPAGAAPKN
jgi:tetratricopeptide (TPR) repeat protein